MSENIVVFFENTMMSHCLNKHLTIFSLLTFYRPLFLSFPLYLISLVLFHPGQTHHRSLSPIAVIFIPLNVWGKQRLLWALAPLLEIGFEACLDRLKMSRTGYFSFHSAFWAGNCCLCYPFSPVLEPRQGGDIRYSGLC